MTQERTFPEADETRFLVICPRCGSRFPINLDCITFAGCESDPHYGTDLKCPNCGYEEDIHHGAGR